jgi:hypothetical protein
MGAGFRCVCVERARVERTCVCTVHVCRALMTARLPSRFASGRYLAVNVGTDRNLSNNWQLLDPAVFAMGPNVGNANSCPSARYNPQDGYYYVMGGGNAVDVVRSPNLTLGCVHVGGALFPCKSRGRVSDHRCY